MTPARGPVNQPPRFQPTLEQVFVHRRRMRRMFKGIMTRQQAAILEEIGLNRIRRAAQERRA